MFFKRCTYIIVLWIACTGLISCNSMDDVVCTLDIRVKTIEVVNEHGDPVSGLDLEIINKRTGRPLCEPIQEERKRESCLSELREFGGTPGRYVIISSLNNAELDFKGDVKHRDTIVVTARMDGEELFTQEYIVVMGLGMCHPERLIGPQEVVVELPED